MKTLDVMEPVELTNTAPGYGSRLNKMLDTLGYREYGRKSLLAKWSGLTVAGVGKTIYNDKVPVDKNKVIDLVESILKVSKRKFPNSTITKTGIWNYLFANGEFPLPEIGVCEENQNPYKALDPITQGRVHLRISQSGKNLGVNVFKDLSHFELEKMLNRISALHLDKKIDIDSDEMSKIAEAMITLSVNEVLQ